MPELPEVETVKNVLKPIVIGKKILSIDILRKTIIKNDDIDEFVNGLIDETFLDITRIGKFLIFHLSHDKVMISHLRMEGKYFEVDEEDQNTKYARVVFHLDNGHKLCYDDSRTFGMMKLTDENHYRLEKDIAQLGPEPFNADPKILKRRCEKSHLPIKSTLLDQTLMTGLGNIYADEVCFACKLHPLTQAKDLTLNQWKDIVNNSIRILNNAIEAGGSTIRSYHPGKGIDGNFQTALLAYGKVGEECPRCGRLFRFMKVGGRGTTFCPNCQVRVGKPHKIAIFGKSGSGKSEVSKIFLEAGYPTISADEVVKDLYQKEEVINKVNKLFGLPQSKEIDRNLLRKHLIDNPKDVKKINALIHPLVRKEINYLIDKQDSDLVIAEVPLLFEAKMENDFDTWVAVDVNEKTQLERLNKRNQLTAESIKKINSYSKFEENKKKADFVINNNLDLKSLDKQVKAIINKCLSRLG